MGQVLGWGVVLFARDCGKGIRGTKVPLLILYYFCPRVKTRGKGTANAWQREEPIKPLSMESPQYFRSFVIAPLFRAEDKSSPQKKYDTLVPRW